MQSISELWLWSTKACVWSPSIVHETLSQLWCNIFALVAQNAIVFRDIYQQSPVYQRAEY